MKKLSVFAQENNLTYNQAWRQFQAGQIPNATKLPNGSIVIEEMVASTPQRELKVYNESKIITVAAAGEEVSSKRSHASTRQNAISTMPNPLGRWANIESGLLPYTSTNNHLGSNGYINIRDTVLLVTKAYFNFSVVRNVIDLMTEFSTSEVFLTGGSKKSRDFFTALFKKVNLKGFQAEFFREYFRSGNVFVFRFDVKAKEEDVIKITQVFGLESKAAQILLPSRYILLNPADIQLQCGSSFISGTYVKFLSQYEKEVLKKPRTQEDKDIFNSLPPETKAAIESNNAVVSMPLDMSRTYYIAYGKQSYEPFGVSLIFPVLDDIEWKSEMKKIDAALARTVQQAILLVTTGAEPEKGGISAANITALESIFKNESVGRVLITDYTTKAEFIIPQIADILDPRKYEVINQDIRDGLNNILMGGGEKFANKSIALNVFVERLRAAREVFLNEFLNLEIRRIADELGFKNYPEAKMSEINLKDEIEFARIYTRLAEIGVLTPLEALDAIETGRLPTAEESVNNQEVLQGYKDKGYYQPIQGGPQDTQDLAQITQDNKIQMQKTSPSGGKPPGGGQKKSKPKKMTPMGGSLEDSTYFSLVGIKETMISAEKLNKNIEDQLKNKFNLNELDKEQKDVVMSIGQNIVIGENKENWENCIEEYLENPEKLTPQRAEVEDIAREFELNMYAASLMFHSKVTKS